MVAVLLALAADWAGEAFQAVAGRMPLAVLALTPLGFAASCWLARRYFPNSGGSGIPQVIAARHLHGLAAREGTMQSFGGCMVRVGRCQVKE